MCQWLSGVVALVDSVLLLLLLLLYELLIKFYYCLLVEFDNHKKIIEYIAN